MTKEKSLAKKSNTQQFIKFDNLPSLWSKSIQGSPDGEGRGKDHDQNHLETPCPTSSR